MKKDKYYTPSIEEFHVGFEYEVRYFKNWDKVLIEEFETSDSDGALHYHIPTELSLERFRVKYLDKKDIESLGFKHYMNSVKDTYKLNDFVLRIKNNIILIFRYDEYTIDELLFKGIIKNKSELKRLLNQLNIIDE